MKDRETRKDGNRGIQGKTGENRERWGTQGKTVQRVSELEILDVANKDPWAGNLVNSPSFL